MALPGLSTLGIEFGYKASVAKPTSGLTVLSRINSIGGISLSTQSIDASSLTDEVTRRIAGRADTDETLPVTVNITPETITEWETLITAFNNLATGEELWFEIYHPRMEKAIWFKAEPPKKIPAPSSDQNQLWTVQMQLVVTEYVGWDTAVAITSTSGTTSSGTTGST